MFFINFHVYNCFASHVFNAGFIKLRSGILTYIEKTLLRFFLDFKIVKIQTVFFGYAFELGSGRYISQSGIFILFDN